MSNAEQYFGYDKGRFRANMRALPLDESSVVLHTHAIDSTRYHYIWQDARTYVDWADRTKSILTMIQEANMPIRGKLEHGAWRISAPTAPALTAQQ